MTMGIPTSFFDDADLQAGFLEIARVAYELYELYLDGPMNGDRIRRTEARLKLGRASASVGSKPAGDSSDVRNWIRMEAEAALHWPFQSPAVADGPYAKLDIGAGTTNASIFRIVASPQSRYLTKERISFFGACSKPHGMDAIDAAIAKATGMQFQEAVSLRGHEDAKLQHPAVFGAITSTIEQIHCAYRDAWARARPKLRTDDEQRAWTKHKLFFIGGGSRIARLTQQLSRSPLSQGGFHESVDLARPDDLFIKQDERVAPADMVFLAVAHGLSNPALSIPEADTPGEVPPMDARGPQPKKPKPWDDERDAWRWQ